MAANYVLLEKITVGEAGASSVTFTSIPQTGYTDLVLRISARTTRSSVVDAISLSFNGLATNQTCVLIEGSGNATSSGTLSSFRTLATSASATASIFGNSDFYIPNYTSANYKSASADGVSETNASNAYAWLTANLWSATAAITSISVTDLNSASFVQYSTFYLYGVAAYGTTPAIVPYATGGDTIMTDGSYWYHAFVSSGTFTPLKGLSCDALVIAGGAGGAGGTFTNANSGGGGGAGGLYYSTGNSVSSAQTVTIGAGGAGGNTSTGVGANGVNSVFGSLTAAVGGGGGGAEAVTNNGFASRGSNGGSGGGNSANTSVATGTSGQGNNGGNAGGSGGGGGGGGSGAVGGTGTSTGGVGGDGVNTYSAFLSATGLGVSGYIAGGGGGGKYQSGAGGAGGAGGGGTGGSGGIDDDTAGTTNTGSGGGGASQQAGVRAGSAGGSGLVIVRYAV